MIFKSLAKIYLNKKKYKKLKKGVSTVHKLYENSVPTLLKLAPFVIFFIECYTLLQYNHEDMYIHVLMVNFV